MSDESLPSPPPGGQFLVYQTEDGKLKLDVRFEGETVWLTQPHMTELFQTTQQNISLHLQNNYSEGELERGATHKESLLVRREGARSVQRRVDFYNLDAIRSVGYRAKSAPSSPTPDELWAVTFAEADAWRDRFAAIPFEDKDGSHPSRYYQDIAVERVMQAIAEERQPVLHDLPDLHVRPDERREAVALFRRAGVYLLAQGRHERRLPHAVQGEADSDHAGLLRLHARRHGGGRGSRGRQTLRRTGLQQNH